MCGDYLRARSLESHNKGSPLHVRGLQVYALPVVAVPRITPACAGTTITISQ